MKIKKIILLSVFVIISGCVGYSSTGVLGTGVSIALDPRSLGTQIDDSLMQQNLRARLLSADKSYIISVKTKILDGRIFLTGKVNSVEDKLKITKLAPPDVDRLRLELLKDHSNGTVRNVLELLRRIINFGVSQQLYPPLSWTIKLPKPDPDSERIEVLTDETGFLCTSFTTQISRKGSSIQWAQNCATSTCQSCFSL